MLAIDDRNVLHPWVEQSVGSILESIKAGQVKCDDLDPLTRGEVDGSIFLEELVPIDCEIS